MRRECKKREESVKERRREKKIFKHWKEGVKEDKFKLKCKSDLKNYWLFNIIKILKNSRNLSFRKLVEALPNIVPLKILDLVKVPLKTPSKRLHIPQLEHPPSLTTSYIYFSNLDLMLLFRFLFFWLIFFFACSYFLFCWCLLCDSFAIILLIMSNTIHDFFRFSYQIS